MYVYEHVVVFRYVCTCLNVVMGTCVYCVVMGTYVYLGVCVHDGMGIFVICIFTCACGNQRSVSDIIPLIQSTLYFKTNLLLRPEGHHAG